MVSKIIEEQLRSCVYADLSHFDANTNIYLIPKYTKPQYNINKCYLIKLPNFVINNTTSVLATNWNNGLAPKNEYYKAYISKMVGKMIYCDCLAYDFNNKCDLTEMWSGYLSVDEITQIGEIK